MRKNGKDEDKMAIKLNLNTTIIPVEIGDFNFEINMTDEKEKAFQTKLNDFLKQAEQLNESHSEDEEKLQTMIAEMYDELLGDGAFDQLYAHTPNVGILLGVFMQLVAEFAKEAKSRVLPSSVLKIVEKKPKKPVAKSSANAKSCVEK